MIIRVFEVPTDELVDEPEVIVFRSSDIRFRFLTIRPAPRPLGASLLARLLAPLRGWARRSVPAYPRQSTSAP